MTTAEVMSVLADGVIVGKLAAFFGASLGPMAFLLGGARMVWDGYR